MTPEAKHGRERAHLGARDLLHDLGENLVCVDILRFRLEIEDDAMAQCRKNHLRDILIADMDSSVR